MCAVGICFHGAMLKAEQFLLAATENDQKVTGNDGSFELVRLQITTVAMLDMGRKSNIVKESLQHNIRSSQTLKVISVIVQHGHRCHGTPRWHCIMEICTSARFCIF